MMRTYLAASFDTLVRHEGVRLFLLLLPLTVYVAVPAKGDEQPATKTLGATLDWLETTALPDSIGVAGPFVGVHNDALIVAGGANFPKQPYWENDKVWHDRAWVLRKVAGGDYQWLIGESLSQPVAYGAVASTSRGVVCMGGDDGTRVTDRCFLMSWDAIAETLRHLPLPSLPAPCAYGSAAVVGDTVYLAAGQSGRSLETATNNFWRLDLSLENLAWETLPPYPGPARAFQMTVAQHNGFDECVYLFGGRCVKRGATDASDIDALRDNYEFNPRSERWRQRADLPHPLMAGAAVAMGQSHVITLSGADGSLWDEADRLRLDHPGFPKRSLAYHTITNTWVDAGPTPVNQVTTPPAKWGDRYVLVSGETQPGIRTDSVWEIRLSQRGSSFGVLNFSVLAVYLLAMVGVGVYFARASSSTDDYFRGGQQMLWWAAGCSIFATMLSSITFVAIPAKAYSQDLVYLIGNCTILVVAPIAVYVALPFFRKIDATSAYEYLEKRFNRPVRLFASLSFILFHIFRMAIVMSLGSLTLATVTPMTPLQSVMIIGVLSTVYCTLGGVEAVIWTDTIQTLVLLGGALCCLVVLIIGTEGGPADWWQTALADGKLRIANLHFDPTDASLALWVVVLGGIGQNLSSYTADQAVVQRYMTTPDQRRAANSIWFAAVLAIPASLIFFMMGTGLYLFYKAQPEKLDPAFTTDQILPLFIATELPVGIAGLLVAGIFAAAQSTVSTSMNSTATAIVTDFLRPFGLLASERGYLRAAKVLTGALGVVGTCLALVFVSPDIRSLFDEFVRVIGLFMGVLGGLFALGTLTRRASGVGAIFGAVTAVVVMGAMPYYSSINGFLYASIGLVICFVVGYISSGISPPPARNTQGLTIFS